MPHNQAQTYLIMAHKDYRALINMTGEEFAIEIFGFHAQQVVEKTLKAWIKHLGGVPPITHNIAFLLSLLEDMGQDIQDWQALVELNSFAVQFCYEQYEDDIIAIDRAALITHISELLKMVDQLIDLPDDTHRPSD